MASKSNPDMEAALGGCFLLVAAVVSLGCLLVSVPIIIGLWRWALS